MFTEMMDELSGLQSSLYGSLPYDEIVAIEDVALG